jgi:HSP20 family molecular chaperone IbpA
MNYWCKKTRDLLLSFLLVSPVWGAHEDDDILEHFRQMQERMMQQFSNDPFFKDFFDGEDFQARGNGLGGAGVETEDHDNEIWLKTGIAIDEKNSDMKITVTEETIQIKSEVSEKTEKKDKTNSFQSMSKSSFSYQLPTPEGVDHSHHTAAVIDGKLVLKFPKLKNGSKVKPKGEERNSVKKSEGDEGLQAPDF